MSDIDGDLETTADFAQFAEDAGIVSWLLDSDPDGKSEEVSHAPDDTEGAVERPRDDQGRFVSTREEEQEEAPEEAEDGKPVPVESLLDEEDVAVIEEDADDGIVIELDDDLQAILEKYDGDFGKALRALNESQSMIGRQGNELGDLRRELQEMRQAMQQGFQQAPQQPQYVGPYTNSIDEDPRGLVMEALERGDGVTMEKALRAWGDYEPFEAATFLITLQQQAAAAPAAPDPAPTAPTTPQGPSLEDAMADVVSRHPDVEKYLPQVEQVSQEFPTLRESMRAGTPAAQAQAFEELLKIAKTRSLEGDTSKAMKRVILRTQEEVRKEKADAAVVSAKNRSAASSRESKLDQFYEMFGEATEQFSGGDWITRSND